MRNEQCSFKSLMNDNIHEIMSDDMGNDTISVNTELNNPKVLQTLCESEPAIDVSEKYTEVVYFY